MRARIANIIARVLDAIERKGIRDRCGLRMDISCFDSAYGDTEVTTHRIPIEQRLQTGTWTAYAKVAGSYGGLHNPVTSVTDLLHTLVHASNPFAYALAPIWQFLLVTVMLAAAVTAAIRSRERPELVAWCVGVWFVPLLQTGQSLWRSEAALVLMAPLLSLLPRRAVWLAAVALAVLAYGLAHEFFAGTLI